MSKTTWAKIIFDFLLVFATYGGVKIAQELGVSELMQGVIIGIALTAGLVVLALDID